MAGDPAASFLQAQSGANEAQDLGNLSAQQNIAKQQFAQQGQQNWLNSLNQFESAPGNVQSEGSWTGAVPYATPGQQVGNAIGSAGTGLAAYGLQQQSNNNQLNWLQSLSQNPSGYAPTVGNSPQPDFSALNI